MSRRNIQAAGSATAAGAASADAIKTAATTADDREFTRLYRQASPSGRKQIAHLVYALTAGSERRMIACAYNWAAFVAVNPVVAFHAVPALRRFTRICIVVIAVGVMLALMTACSGDNAGDDSSAKYGQPAHIENNAGTMQPATDPPAPTATPQISATENPDMQPQALRVEVAQIESTQTPQPAQCDAAQPMPTIQPDATDIAAGVVLRGQWQPCAYQTAVAVQAVQP